MTCGWRLITNLRSQIVVAVRRPGTRTCSVATLGPIRVATARKDGPPADLRTATFAHVPVCPDAAAEEHAAIPELPVAAAGATLRLFSAVANS